MSGGKTILMIFCALLAGAAGSFLYTSQLGSSNASSTAKETPYERIMRTQTIRCGYIVWPPFIIQDPNTKALSGISYDYMEELSKLTGLKVDWVEEVNFGTYITDLENNKYDAECAEGWPNAERGKHVFYGNPHGFLPLYAYVRADDDRFDSGKFSDIDKPDVTVVTMDGENSSIIYRQFFSRAKQDNLSPLAGINTQMSDVQYKKADVAMRDTVSAYYFAKNNPGVLKRVPNMPPLHLIALTPTLSPDVRLKNLFDLATDQMLWNGTIERIFRKWEPEAGIILRMRKPVDLETK